MNGTAWNIARKRRLGGKCGTASGDPLDLHVTVRGIAHDVTQRFGVSPCALGTVAWVEAAGLDPAQRQILLVKSTQHFHAGFAPIAKAVLYADPPGTLRTDFADIPYTKLKRPYWPRVADPFAAS